MMERLRSSGTLRPGAAQGVGHDTVAVNGDRRLALATEILVLGRDPRIANVLAEIVSKVSSDYSERNGDFETRF
jgi:hypothetical protein